jgi:hypothetical protein
MGTLDLQRAPAPRLRHKTSTVYMSRKTYHAMREAADGGLQQKVHVWTGLMELFVEGYNGHLERYKLSAAVYRDQEWALQLRSSGSFDIRSVEYAEWQAEKIQQGLLLAWVLNVILGDHCDCRKSFKI